VQFHQAVISSSLIFILNQKQKNKKNKKNKKGTGVERGKGKAET
jgi:hypothetical protein